MNNKLVINILVGVSRFPKPPTITCATQGD
jgi:hypothetical protein